MITMSFYDFEANKMFEKQFTQFYTLKVFLQRIFYGDSKLLPHHYSFCGYSDSAIYEMSDEIDYWRNRTKQKLIKSKVFDLSKLYG